MSRIPIRIRVTLAFAVVMAVVLAAVGLFVYSQTRARLDESIDTGLRSRAGELSALAHEADGGRLSGAHESVIEQEESLAQVLSPRGRVIDTTDQLQGRPVLSGTELRQARSGSLMVERPALQGIEGRARLFAAPTAAGAVVVVGASLQDRDEALASLSTVLLIGGPVALLLASAAGYGAVALSLRPVEAMRRRAALISAGEPDERLPVPAAKDELSRLGETLNEMLARLAAALEHERRFVDDASHELRTPLALHKAELELALRYATSEGELRAAIASAVEENDRLIQLAEDLLVVARSEEGELAVNLEALSVGELFATLGERFRARASESGRRLVVENAGGLVVEGDRLRLEQALTSMADNALRYGQGDVRFWAKLADGRVELHVSDAGPGFPPDFIDRAFERFSRADAARVRGGTGLGLAIVETIATAHGGRARVVNDPAGGADVWIEIASANRGPTS